MTPAPERPDLDPEIAYARQRDQELWQNGFEAGKQAAVPAPDARLDVERLAWAIQGAMTDTGKAVDYSPLAHAIAAEYVALSRQAEKETA